jgi:hypothetical protein
MIEDSDQMSASFVKCKIEGCEDRVRTGNLCSHHYHIEKTYDSCICIQNDCNALSVLKGKCAKHQLAKPKKPRDRSLGIPVRYAPGIHD